MSKGVARTTTGHMGSCKGQMGTALGQAQDKTKTEKGPHRGKVQFYRKNLWNHPILNREPLEPLVPKQKTIGTAQFLIVRIWHVRKQVRKT